MFSPALWIGPSSMPCLFSRYDEPLPTPPLASDVPLSSPQATTLYEGLFSITLPEQQRTLDQGLGYHDAPFDGILLAFLPPRTTVLSLQIEKQNSGRDTTFSPQALVPFFVYRRHLTAVVEGLCEGAQIRLCVSLSSKAKPKKPILSTFPPELHSLLIRLRRVGHAFLLKHKRPPAPSEIAEALGLPLSRATELLTVGRAPFCREDVREGALPRLQVRRSEAIELAGLSDTSLRGLAKLSSREETILRMRFGIGEASDHTLEEVGHDFEITRERIRPIEAKALRKLRHPSASKRLKSFTEDS